MTTRNISKALMAAVAALLFAGIGFADTLELKDGRVLQGRYLGGTQAILRFEVNGDVQTFPTHDIVALTFTRGGGRRAAEPPPPPPPNNPPDNPPPGNPPNDPPQAAAPAAPPQGYNGGDFTLPAGQPMMVRLIDGVDSSKNHVGDIIQASMEKEKCKRVLVARGSDVYGRLASSDEGGKPSGKSGCSWS
jgi:hypothetical protein